MADQQRSNAEEAVAQSYGLIAGTIRRQFAIHGPNSRAALAKLVIEECGKLAPRQKTNLAAIIGKWPGDETDEEIEAALRNDE